MGCLSGLGIGLSFVFGCILMGVVAELYYLLWVRKRIPKDECYNISSEQVSRNAGEMAQDLELGDMLLKGYGEDSVETELMRLHNLCGPPRFLFTIKEETKEDLESTSTSFSDLILTPLSSPPIKLDSYYSKGFNPLFEAESRSSPPPTFKFLRDAEEKLIRRLIQDSALQQHSFISFL